MSIFSVSSPSVGTLNPKFGKLALLGAIAAFSLFGATGCYARARVRAQPAVVATYEYQEPVYEEPVVYVQTVPVHIETYPRVYYRGSYVYYVDGRWYAPSRRGGWVYYRSEPRDLVRHRVEFDRRPRVTSHVTTRVEAPRVRVEAPRVQAHVEAHGSVRAGAGSHPAKPSKRRDK